MSTVHFPVRFDGRLVSCHELMRLSGYSRWDLLKALEADPTINTLAALRAAVVARKARPARARLTIRRSSQLWNGADRLRKP